MAKQLEVNPNQRTIDALHAIGIEYSSGWVKLADNTVLPASDELVIEIAEDDKAKSGSYRSRTVQITE